jgi:hypothetical protein
MKENTIGRKEEIAKWGKYLESGKPELSPSMADGVSARLSL